MKLYYQTHDFNAKTKDDSHTFNIRIVPNIFYIQIFIIAHDIKISLHRFGCLNFTANTVLPCYNSYLNRIFASYRDIGYFQSIALNYSRTLLNII